MAPVIGGAGGIGEVVSEYLIRHYRARMVWIVTMKLRPLAMELKPAMNTATRAKVVALLMASPELFDVAPRTLKARGVALVLESDIRRSDQGGRGSFSPSRVASQRT